MTTTIGQILADREVSCVFQPIIDASDQSLLGYEALARGPADTPLVAPQKLFAAAHAENLGPQLDLLCLETAATRFAQLKLQGRLFLNITPGGLLYVGCNTDSFEGILEAAGISPDMTVLELTEQAILEDYDAIRASIDAIRSLGIAFAIDDLGAGYSTLRAWSELNPDYVKVDRYFVSAIDEDPLKMEFVRAIIDMARATRSLVIAEGVETQAEATELRDAGVAFLQGFYVQPPKSEPETTLSETVIERVRFDTGFDTALTARDLVFDVAPVSPTTRVREVAKLFHDKVDLQALPVVDDDIPVGITRRSELLDLLSLPLRHELYGRKPIEVLMDNAPLLVESDLRLEQVSRLVTRSSQERLQEQFIITHNGHFLGMGRAIDLLKSITQEQVRTARYSNPLTTLPGNVPIYDYVNGLLRRGRRFVQCHVDIDNFKPFNDFYGYSKGDEALVAVSKILIEHTRPRIDFVGHLGGDDFVIVFRSPDWRERLAEMFADIDKTVRTLYRKEHQSEGGITTRDRNGVERMFPFLSVSVAAVECENVEYCTAEDLAYWTAPIKARAKQRAGNALEVETYADLAEDAVLSVSATIRRAAR